MSHIVTVKTQFKDMAVLAKTCIRLGIPGKFGQKIREKIFQTEAEGVACFKLPGWQFPVVVSEDGKIRFDNYQGAWGKQEELNKLTKEYAKDFSVGHLQRQGYRVESERVENDGSLVVTLVQ
jgi:hypothetical protein